MTLSGGESHFHSETKMDPFRWSLTDVTLCCNNDLEGVFADLPRLLIIATNSSKYPEVPISRQQRKRFVKSRSGSFLDECKSDGLCFTCRVSLTFSRFTGEKSLGANRKASSRQAVQLAKLTTPGSHFF